MKFRTLTYAVIGTLLFFAFRPTAVDAVQTQTTTVPASRGKTEQTGTFQAGPGIAIATTESGKVQGYVQDGIYNYRDIPYAEATERFKPAKRYSPGKALKCP